MRSSAAIKTFNTLLILLGLALIIISYPKLFLERAHDVIDDTPSIGKILSIKNDARLKRSFLFNWDNSSSGDSIHNNDLIFTNENSQAVFELSKGQEVTLKSQTLLRLKDQSLEVKNGEVELSLTDPSKELIIVVGDQEFTLKSSKKSKVTVSSGDGESRFKVSQGEVSIQTENASLSAKAGEEILASHTDTSKALSDVELIFPKNETIALGKEDTFKFETSKLDSDAKVFAQDLETGKEYLRDISSPTSLPPGSYTWKVVREGESISHPANFTVVEKLGAPSLTSPKDLEEIVFYDDKTQVNFEWSKGPALLQIIDEFENLHFSELIEGKSKEVEFFNEGSYQWKTRLQTESAESPWSQTRKIIVTKIDYEQGEPVVIELKRPNQVANFSWNGTPSKGANFKLSKTKDFKNIVHQQEIGGMESAQVNIAEVGVYYWKIEDNQPKRFVPTKVIIRPTPAPGKPKTPPKLKLKLRPKKRSASWFSFFSNAYAENFEEVTVAFEEIEDAKLYEIEIYSDQNQQRLLETIQTEKPNFKWTPPRAGSYTWRIRYQDYWGRWSPFSDPSQLAAALDSRFLKKPKRKVVKKKPKKIKRKKRPVKKPEPKLSRKAPVAKPKVYANSFSALYSPASITYEDKNAQTIEVQGEALGGHAFEYRSQGSWPILVNYQSNYGEVFEGEDFASRSLELGLGKTYGSFTFSATALVKDVSDFELEDSSPTEAGRISAFGIGLNIISKLRLFGERPLIVEASAHGLGLTQAALSIGYDFAFKERLLLQTKLRGEFATIKDGDNEISSQSLQAFIGPKFLF